MGISVNDFSADSLTGKVYSKYSTTEIDTNVTDSDSSSYLDFEGYLKLLTSQMSNQDFNNAMSDSEFIQQMASYSMMEAISQLTKQNAVTYASSLIGKAVTVQTSTGAPDTGIVESVTVTSDGCKVLVNGSLYATDGISDVVDGTVYSQLRSFVGQTVEVKDGDATVTGKVTGIIIKNGNGYVTLDNKFSYDMTAITNVITPEEDGDETDSTENSENASAEQASDNVSEAQAEEYEAGAVNRGEAAGTLYASEASYNALMKMLDDAADDDTSPIDAEFRSAKVNSRLGDMSRYMSANVNTQAASSGLSSDRIPAPYSAAAGTNNYYQPEASQTNGVYYNTNTQTNAAQSRNSSYDRGETSGVVSVSDHNAESTSLYQYTSETSFAEMPSSSRKYADKYPVEAAFADAVGTHMTDIRFIGNTSVNSKIDTSSILCYSPSGRAVTDIGWCGKGRLGEVITFADGRQRVEIIGPTEVSYLYTSGKYTLDEICDYTIVDGSLQGKLDPFETAIRHYAKEYTEAEKKAMKEFEQYALWHAATQYGKAETAQ
ncbi:MAG: flagellar hook assembly protein FlgD [Huintestinicola sp.]|uniref:flagellar hook assembly protein FlgD n=1 Tax=Huintestinicola sp. TaxID=2981661 RepID=UPI003F0C63C2